MCWQQGLQANTLGEPIDLADANRFGQQLFLANMHAQPRHSRDKVKPRRRLRAASRNRPAAAFTPVGYRQLALFPARPDLSRRRSLPPAPDPTMANYCDNVLREHAACHGWSTRVINAVGLSLQVLQAWQDTPGATIKASEAQTLLSQRGLTVEATLEVLGTAELLDDDRVPAIREFFLAQTVGLPAPMTAQLQTWYSVMVEGSSLPPRRRPRHHQTIHLQIRGMSPSLRAWAVEGYESLAEITAAQIVATLPADRIPRLETGAGLRSLFTILKARKVIFTNPTAGVPIGPKPSNIPLPLNTSVIRAALNSSHPTRALAVALVAFHALTARQICNILLSDIHDGRLTIGDRDIPLAAPVRVRLAVYLDHRARRWPITTNPYLVINRRSAPRSTPVDTRYPWHRFDVQPRALREDRILHEIHASGGDVRRICDLFGLSIDAAMRYAATREHPDLAEGGVGSRTYGTN